MFSSVLLLFGLASISQYVALEVSSEYKANIQVTKVKHGDIPYQIILQNATSHKFFCGGSLVNSLYVVTAAQCVYGRNSKDIIVFAGIVTLNFKLIHYRYKRTVREIITHEQYDPFDPWRNDIALLRFKRYIFQTEYVQHVGIPTEHDRQNAEGNVLATVSGYGIISENHQPNFPWLMQLKTYIDFRKYCKDVFKLIPYNISETQICAHDPYIPSILAVRVSDTGGPLVVNGTLLGIASSSDTYFPKEMYSEAIGPPMVFTNVIAYKNWIWIHILDRADSDVYQEIWNTLNVNLRCYDLSISLYFSPKLYQDIRIMEFGTALSGRDSICQKSVHLLLLIINFILCIHV